MKPFPAEPVRALTGDEVEAFSSRWCHLRPPGAPGAKDRSCGTGDRTRQIRGDKLSDRFFPRVLG